MRLRHQIAALLVAAILIPIMILGYSPWAILVSTWSASALGVVLVMRDEKHHDAQRATFRPITKPAEPAE